MRSPKFKITIREFFSPLNEIKEPPVLTVFFSKDAIFMCDTYIVNVFFHIFLENSNTPFIIFLCKNTQMHFTATLLVYI